MRRLRQPELAGALAYIGAHMTVTDEKLHMWGLDRRDFAKHHADLARHRASFARRRRIVNPGGS